MELLSKNFYETTTQISVSSGSLTASYLMSRDPRFQFVTDGYNNDSLTASITITFDQTTSVDRIALLEVNLKKFNIFYNGVTANAFTLTGPTTTTQWVSNSATNFYLQASSVACTSVTLDLYSTQVANVEKAIGYLLLSANEYTFPRVPAAGDYKPVVKPKQLKHELSNGGIRTHTVDQKFSVKLKFKYLSDSDVVSLRTVYDAHEPKVFVPFGTATSWDGILFEANWTGSFEFYTYSDNATAAGHTGSITLEET